jgi:flagellar basal body-associated protein FliL
MKERVIIIFIAIILGLLVTSGAFLLYQATKTVEQPRNTQTTAKNPLPTPQTSPLLVVSEPKDESVTKVRKIQIKGKTNPQNTIVVSSAQEDVVGLPTTGGDFAITVEIPADTDIITIRAIAPNGQETKEERIISFSGEEF